MTSTRAAEILSGVAVPGSDDGDLPQRLVRACARALPVSGVGMVLMTDDGPAGTVAVTDGPAATLEDLQFTLGEGPGVEASRTGRPVLQPDLPATGATRWPGFTPAAVGDGICAVFAFPLRMGGIRLGVLDLYRDRPGPLSDAELAEALSFSDAATTVLLRLQSLDPDHGGPLGAVPLVEDRAEVHQATGMVSVHARVSLAQALALLQARAYAAGLPISHLAQDVLDGAVAFWTDDRGRIHD